MLLGLLLDMAKATPSNQPGPRGSLLLDTHELLGLLLDMVEATPSHQPASTNTGD